jgi:5-methylcytosine-specific restriction protein A
MAVTGLARPCRRLGCPRTTREPHGLCAAHRAEQRQREDAERGSARERGYRSPRWLATRARILARDPICRFPGCRRPSTDCAHIVPRSEGGSDDERNLRGLCHAHHSAETARDESWQRRKRGWIESRGARPGDRAGPRLRFGTGSNPVSGSDIFSEDP